MRKKFNNTLLIFILILSSCGVKDEKFNSRIWKEMDGNSYSKREPLINDLIKNHLYKGMKYREIKDLLGNPEIFGEGEKNRIGYILQIDYDMIDPIRGKDLIVDLSKDSTVSNYRIIEWKK